MACVRCRLTHVGRHVEREIVLMASVGCRLTRVGRHVENVKPKKGINLREKSLSLS